MIRQCKHSSNRKHKGKRYTICKMKGDCWEGYDVITDKECQDCKSFERKEMKYND